MLKREGKINEYLLNKLMSGSRLPFNSKLHSSLPNKAGVYYIFEETSTKQIPLYLGKATNLYYRVYKEHFMGTPKDSNLKGKLINSHQCKDGNDAKQYLRERCFVQYVEIEDESLRNSFERFAINSLKPRYNF